MKVTVEKNGVRFELRCNIREDIMKLESTKKTKALGVPEYMTRSYTSKMHDTYISAGWKATVWH